MIGSLSAADPDNTIDESELSVSNSNSLLTADSDDDSQFLLQDEDVTDNEKNSTTLRGNDTELYYKNGTAYQVELLDNSGSPLNNQSIIFSINGNNYTRHTNDNGIASIALDLSSGTYNITSYYKGSTDYENSTAVNLIKVLPTLYGEDVEKYYKNDTQYYATFFDGQGNPLNKSEVTFNINGVLYKRYTNQNGVAKLNINLFAGEYIITAINTFNNETRSNFITVLPTIFGDDIEKYYRNNTQYFATFFDGTGNSLNNKEVTFNINGVLYKRYTNSDGTARLNINLNPGTYIITATNMYNQENAANSITVLPTISADDLAMTYKDGSRFTAHVLDDTGNALAGSKVTFNVNGRFYNRTSDSEGNVYLAINLNSGDYIITATNEKGLSASNNIIIKKCDSVLEGGDIHAVSDTYRRFSVRLTGLNNKTIESATVHFSYANQATTALTGSDGVATAVISKLEKGNYIINYFFEGDWNYHSSKSSSILVVEDSTVLLTGNDLNMLYNDGSMFNVTLTDLNHNPLANRTVTFMLNGAEYNRTTDTDGAAGLSINLNPGVYTVSYSHSTENETDYNFKSNLINVAKLPAALNANDLIIKAGNSGTFDVTLTDSNNAPIENKKINFNINGASYKRTTDSSGVARLTVNLGVGYYEITTSFDDLIYSANTISNHILVDGFIITASDKNTIAGVTDYFSARLLDPYGRPVSNAEILFSYYGVTSSAITDGNGKATISFNLPEGDHVIVYNYAAGNTAGQSVIHSKGSVLNTRNTISDLGPYLGNSNNCPVTNPIIVSLAAQLTEGLTSPIDKAMAIYNYVRDGVSYSHYYNTRHGALGTLDLKSGNCVDQSHLLIALYRASGLPARYVHGICEFGDETSGHVWVQVLLDNTWVVCDPINVRNSVGKVVNWNNYNYNLKGYYSSLPF